MVDSWVDKLETAWADEKAYLKVSEAEYVTAVALELLKGLRSVAM